MASSDIFTVVLPMRESRAVAISGMSEIRSAREGTCRGRAPSEVPVGGGRVYFGRNVVVTQPSAGRFVGLSATCTHQGREVGGVSGGVVECGYHGSLFAIADGSVVQGPATKALAPRPVEVRDGDLHLA